MRTQLKTFSASLFSILISGIAIPFASATPLPEKAGVVFIDSMESMNHWVADSTTKLSTSKCERKIGESSLRVDYIIDKDNPGTVWFARTEVGIDRTPTAMQVWVNIPQGQRFTWYDFPKLRMILQDKDGTAMYGDIDKFASRPIYEGGKSYYIPWAEVLLPMDLFYPLWPGENGKLDGIETISFELPHRTEDFMKDGPYVLYLDELSAIFDNAGKSLQDQAAFLRAKNAEFEKTLSALPSGTWQRYPKAIMGVIDLFCSNAMAEYKEGKVVRAARELNYLSELSEKLEKDLKRAGDKNTVCPWPDVPNVRYINLKVKDGSYYDGETPVYINGFCGSATGDEMALFSKLGFNGFSLGIEPAFTQPTKDKTNPPTYIVDVLNKATKYNVAFDLLLGPHGMPQYAFLEYQIDPSGRRRGGAKDAPLSPKNQYMPWNVDHPELRKILAKHLEIVIPAIKNSPALASYDLCNEMWYLCHGDFKAEDFRARLKQRYQTIDRLNKAWGSHFANFDTVQWMAGNEQSVADLYEYNQYRVTEFFRWYTAELQKYDKSHPVYGKIHGCWRQMIGIDKAALSEFFTGMDSDVYPRLGNDEEELIADMWTSSMVTQEYRSLQPDKPIIDSEQHMIWYHQIVTYDFIKSLLWWRAVLGLDANYAWVWSRTCENREECIFTQPWAFNALSTFALDVQRLCQPVQSFQRVKPGVLLLEAGPHTPDAYKICSYSGYAFDLLPTNALNETRLAKYRVIVLPAKPVLDDETRILIESARKKGLQIVQLEETTKVADLRYQTNMRSDIEPSLVSPQNGLVNYPTRDQKDRRMTFLLNLNTTAISCKVSKKAVDLLTGQKINEQFMLEPLKPMILQIQE
jgi:hypothetical protein